MDDRLQSVTERLAALDELPVDQHAEELEQVHQALVAELDAIAGRPAAPAAP